MISSQRKDQLEHPEKRRARQAIYQRVKSGWMNTVIGLTRQETEKLLNIGY